MQTVDEAPGYRILNQAGQGGFAIVYQAYQENLDRRVALKVLSVDRVDQRTMRRFQRELQLTSRLTGHPNVVTVFDTGMTRAGKPYIAMDYFEGGSLRDRLSREGPLPVPDVLRIGVKMAGALAAVHAAGVLHGDVKPQNILISRYGEPALADFGIARVVDSAEVSAMGQAFTPLHAAPEILNGQQQSVASDVYSLGSTLYQLLAGQPAFYNPNEPSIGPLMLRVFNQDPEPIRRSDVPAEVAQAVFRAMAKRPEDRYGTAREFARWLQSLQAAMGLPMTDLIGGDAADDAQPSRNPVPRGYAPGDPRQGGYAPVGPMPGDVTMGGALAGVTGGEGALSGPGRRPVSGDGASAGERPRSRLRGHLVAGMAVAAVAGAGIGVAAFVAVRSGPEPDSAQSAKAGAATSSAKPATTPKGNGSDTIDATVIAALKPRRLKVVADNGTNVTLGWALPANAKSYPLILQQGPGSAKVSTPLQQEATSARVVGLDPSKGYCFRVGVVLKIDTSSTIAWSLPRCVRGAIARSGPGLAVTSYRGP